MKSIKKYETIINEALRSALEYDTPEGQINEFISFFGKQRMQTQAFRAPGRCGNRMRAYRLCHTRGNGNTGQNESATFPPAFGTQALPCGS